MYCLTVRVCLRQFYFLLLLCLGPWAASAQEITRTGNFAPIEPRPEVWALEARQAILIDGKLNEADWQRARPVTDFYRMEPRQGGAYQHTSEVRVLYDKKNIYFGVFCRDSAGKKGLRVQDMRRDFLFDQNDWFMIQLDPQNLKRFCVSFQTTPYGNLRDMQVFDDAFYDSDWDGLYKVRTHITDSGYYAEFSIPFVSLRYDPDNKDSASWGITFARLTRRDYEQTVFPPVPQAFTPFRMTYAAELRGLRLPPPSTNIRVQPYALVESDKSTNAAGETITDTRLKAGGEVKWAVNPNAVLDLTFNTDFAQADVDQAVNNLTRFNVLFPERRQFFLENGGVYTGANYDGIKPFFSRSIGLASTEFNAAPVPIEAGARYTDRNQDRAIAGLLVRQRGNSEQGPSNFGVFRYLKNFGEQSNVGAMITHRLDEGSEALGTKTRNNTTLSIDGLLRGSQELTIEYMASASRDNKNDSIGFSGYLNAEWNSRWLFLNLTTQYVDQKYKPGMGFVFGNNVLQHELGGFFIWRPEKGWLAKRLLRWEPGTFINIFQNANDLKLQEISVDIFPIYITTASNGLIEYTMNPVWQNFNFSFDILGQPVAMGRYNYLRHFLRYNSDASRKISGSVEYEFGGYYNGSLQSVLCSTRLAPSPYASLSLAYEYNQFKNFGENRANFNTNLYTAGLRLAANPRLQLSVFYQYNSFNKLGRWNVRGSWEFAPLSFLYVVFNDNSFRDVPIANQRFISKLTYLKQF